MPHGPIRVTYGPRWALILLAVAPLLIVLTLGPTVAIPFERDEGEYAWAAELLRRGGLPYRDTFLQKPPGIVLAYRVVQATLGDGPVAAHVAQLGLYMVAALALVSAARTFIGDRAAWWSAALFALGLSLPVYVGSAFNTEALVVLGATLAAAALARLRAERRLGWALAVGAGGAIAVFGKQIAAPHAAALVATAAGLGQTNRERLAWAGAASALVAAPYVAAVAWYASAGALPEFLDAVLWHNLAYTAVSLERAFTIASGAPTFATDKYGAALALLGIAGLARLAARRAWWPVWVLGSWVATAWMGASAGHHYRGHYFLPLLPPLALLTGAWLADASRGMRLMQAATLVAAWVWSGGWPYGHTRVALATARYQDQAAEFLEAEPLGAWLGARMTARGDRTLYVAASEPELYHFAAAWPVTRYVIQGPLYGGFATSRARQREVWDALATQPPAFVVARAPALAEPVYPGSDLWLIPRLKALLEARYVPRGVPGIREYLVYERVR